MNHRMGLIQLYSTPKTSASASDPSQAASRCHDENPSFCRCQRTDMVQRKLLEKQKPKCQMNLSSSQLSDHVVRKVYLDPPKSDKPSLQLPPDTCRCGEDTCQTINWTWDTEAVQPQTIINNQTVQFHPIYSQGTSVIRSNQPLAPNMIHYWEVKIVHWLSGTDLVSNFSWRYSFVYNLVCEIRAFSWEYENREKSAWNCFFPHQKKNQPRTWRNFNWKVHDRKWHCKHLLHGA